MVDACRPDHQGRRRARAVPWGRHRQRNEPRRLVRPNQTRPQRTTTGHAIGTHHLERASRERTEDRRRHRRRPGVASSSRRRRRRTRARDQGGKRPQEAAVIDTATAYSGGWWLRRLAKRVTDNFEHYCTLDEYYRNEQQLEVNASKAVRLA